MDQSSFQVILDVDTDGTWFYVHVPKPIRDKYKHLEVRGITAVTVTVGQTTWAGSMLPWADGSAQIVINKAVRTKEHLIVGQDLNVTITPR